MNDPMEGIYRTDEKMNYPAFEPIFKEKSDKLLCSFSGEEALKNPLMWGYYCDGFKGVALEVEISVSKLSKVTYLSVAEYADNIVHPNFDIPTLVHSILTTKLSSWEHEKEYRFLTTGELRKQPIGKIVSIILGRPYPKGLDNPDVDNRHAQITNFERRLRAVKNVAENNNISIKEARFRNGTIEIE